MIYFVNIYLGFLFFCFIPSPQHTITGSVYDGGEPFLFLELVIYDQDNHPITATLTDQNGRFELKLEAGTYKLEGRFMGKTLFMRDLIVDSDLDLGIIEVDYANELSEIIVEGKKNMIERQVDRLVFNVEGATAIAGGNALDALRITPRIKVQNEQISMIGKGKMIVMVNDRIMQLSGDDLANFLKTLNAEDLEKIEVITNPPSKYSAEGNSGIINIVTKSAKQEGWNTSVRGVYQQATFATGNTGANFNIQKGKFDLNTSVSYTNGSNAPEETAQLFYPIARWDILNNRRDFADNLSTRLGLSYKLSDKVRTGFSVDYINSQPAVRDDEMMRIMNNADNTLDSAIATKGQTSFGRVLTSLNYYIIYEIGKRGKKLSFDYDFFSYQNRTDRVFSAQSLFGSLEAKPNGLTEARNYGEQDIQNYSFNLDMEHPTTWLNLNYGGRLSSIKTANLFNFSIS
ncbi:MAG: TonB-dependent receptor [Saprospiraceae bacterium]|nr:TonB-dependent receptor [Saprospiraceae bacterium]